MTVDPPARSSSPRQASAPSFTDRETAVLVLVAEGLSNVEAARRLHISSHTVAQHVARMLRGAGARSRAELVARAYCHGLLSSGTWPPILSRAG